MLVYSGLLVSNKYLKVPDDGITLATQEHQIRVWIVQREHNSVRRIQLDHHNRFAKRIWRSQRVLSLRGSIESRTTKSFINNDEHKSTTHPTPVPGCEDESMAQENRLRCFGALVANGFAFDFARSRIDDANLLVLTRRHQLRAGPVEAGAVHDVRMTVEMDQHLGGAHVPDDHLIVGAGGEEHILGGRMPQDETDTTLVE